MIEKPLKHFLTVLLFGGLFSITACQSTNDSEDVAATDTLSRLVTTKLDEFKYQFVILRGIPDRGRKVRWSEGGSGDTLVKRFSAVGLYRVEASILQADSVVRVLDTTILVGDLPLASAPASIFPDCKITFSYFGDVDAKENGNSYLSTYYSDMINVPSSGTPTVTDTSYEIEFFQDQGFSHQYFKLSWILNANRSILRSLSRKDSSQDFAGPTTGSSFISLSVEEARLVGANDSEAVYIVEQSNPKSYVNFVSSSSSQRGGGSTSRQAKGYKKGEKPFASIVFKKR